MAAVIETQDLTRRYGRFTAVDALSFTVEEGDIFGFLGPNGAGKTTTLLMLLGLTEPTAGKARVLGCDPVRQPLEIKRQVGYLPENVGFYDDMTAWENLDFVARLNRLPAAAARGSIETALQQVGLDDVGEKRVGQFSRGMRQRLGLAEMLIKNPRLVFLDEPTLGLDPDGINKILDLILSLSRERGITVVLSSHLLDQVQRTCNRIGIMKQGRMVALGTINELGRPRDGSAGPGDTLEQIYMRYFQEA
ncbi:MAG: ABC transporter ATP-binding protein [Verrucomicrobia bacterium]|nr:ABC transporter ATP-binding protein [Verrucomicrobiota bacterium]